MRRCLYIDDTDDDDQQQRFFATEYEHYYIDLLQEGEDLRGKRVRE